MEKGYWVRDDKDYFEGWSDEVHPGYSFYTHCEFFESVKGCFWCPDAGYIEKCYDNCYSGSMGFCSRK
jgi:hypothetical protein